MDETIIVAYMLVLLVSILFRRFAMIRYSALRGKWDDDLIFSFQKLDKPTSFKDNVISMDVWEEGLVSCQENYFSSLIKGIISPPNLL